MDQTTCVSYLGRKYHKSAGGISYIKQKSDLLVSNNKTDFPELRLYSKKHLTSSEKAVGG